MSHDANPGSTVPGFLLDNVWSDGTGAEPMTITSPHSGEHLATVMESSSADIEAAIASASKTFESGRLAPYDRYRILRRSAELIDERRETLARSVVAEAGKPIRDARAEVARAVLTFELCAEEAKRIGGEYIPVDATPGSENRHAFTIRRPAGIVCAITPFNGPVNQLSHKVPTAIAAGAPVVVKPAEITPLSAILLIQTLLDAGLPPGHVSMVQGTGETVGQRLLEDPRFGVYTFTGSTAVGRHIRRTVGLRKTLLELGNSSANIVHADADLPLAARQLARSMSVYAGQVCISAQRLLVHEDVYDEFAELLTVEVRSLQVGDPSDEATDVGPMISEEAAVRAESWIRQAVVDGAELLCGGERTGSFVTPAVIANPPATGNLMCQEAFAPVAGMVRYRDLARAFELANSTEYGLQAGIFTRSIDVAMAAAEHLVVGGVIVNDASSYRIDSMPYGGVKNSGSGREGVRYAIEEMTEQRLVVLNVQPPSAI
jgi:acyl-CoA reductase-like NAD-dependent aldehyde dehydrogenase